MMRALGGLFVAALLMFAAPAVAKRAGPAQTAEAVGCVANPVLSDRTEVSDTSPAEIASSDSDASPMIRVGNKLYIIYFVDTRGGSPHHRPRYRVMNVNDRTFDAADSTDIVGRPMDVTACLGVDDPYDCCTGAGTGPTCLSQGAHEKPSLYRDLAGNVYFMQPDSNESTCIGNPRLCTPGGPLTVNAAWTPARANNISTGFRMIDTYTIFDPPRGCTYFLSEMASNAAAGAYPPDTGQFGQRLYRVCGPLTNAANYDGPWMITDAASPVLPADTAQCDFCGTGQIFTKTRLVKARHSLHSLWIRNHGWEVCQIAATCGSGVYPACASCVAGPRLAGEYNRSYFYMKSGDGGFTWCPFLGAAGCTASVIPDNPTTFRLDPTDDDFNQTTERAWDVGPAGDLYLLAGAHDDDANDRVPAGGPVDWEQVTPTYNLTLIRHHANTNLTTSTVLTTGMGTQRNIVVAGDFGILLAMREQPYQFRVSYDHGVTWTPWTTPVNPNADGRRIQIYKDDVVLGMVHMLNVDGNSGPLFHRSVCIGK